MISSTLYSITELEAFLSRLDLAESTLVYSTYLGGSGEDESRGVAVDGSGNAYLTGFTKSSDFPLADPIQAAKGGEACGSPPCSDAFVSKVNAAGGVLVYSTYLGGEGEDDGNAIALDGEGNAYVTGYTISADFPTTLGAYDLTYGGNAKSDAFVAKISQPVQDWETTITYTYDPLYRLTGANYSSGEFFDYVYDAVGNRLSETVGAVTTNYTYDTANRLTSVNGVTYSWDNNGNLLSDGVNTYTYNHANRLVSVVGSSMTSSYAYNGLGDRLRQTVDSVMTNYTLDLNSWLIQVLADGTQTYLYGTRRIAQFKAAGAEYFLGDALGSVRQLADEAGEVTLAEAYHPYGETLASAGNGVTSYGFTGEWQDDATGLVYLRARYYAPYLNQFIQPDPIVSNPYNPWEWNRYTYVRNNPVNLTDPSGKVPECDRYQRADLTQWLIDEMNENRKGYILAMIWTGLHFPDLLDILYPGLPAYKLPADLASFGVAYGLFADVVKLHGLWDFKWRIQRYVGNNIQLTGNWYANEVPGNIYFGFIGLAAGFDRDILHCGADFATNRKLCSGSDPIQDYEAVEAGYDIYEQSGWGPVNEHMLEIALARHPLIDSGIEKEPKPKAYEFPWPYPIGTFDDGSSGWIIKHR